jgi:hypothetical protein
MRNAEEERVLRLIIINTSGRQVGGAPLALLLGASAAIIIAMKRGAPKSPACCPFEVFLHGMPSRNLLFCPW